MKDVNPTAHDMKALIRPLVSLHNKCEKAQQKCQPGTWQHARLQHNREALSYALAHLRQEVPSLQSPTIAEQQAMKQTLENLCDVTEQALQKSTSGTASHTLLCNRLRALRVAASVLHTPFSDTEIDP